MSRRAYLSLGACVLAATALAIGAWVMIVDDLNEGVLARQVVAVTLFSVPAVAGVVAWLRSRHCHRRRNVVWLGLYYLLAIVAIPVFDHAKDVIAILWISGPAVGFLIVLFSPPQIPAGTCRRCGYDLRATPQRCPECGADAAPRGGA